MKIEHIDSNTRLEPRTSKSGQFTFMFIKDIKKFHGDIWYEKFQKQIAGSTCPMITDLTEIPEGYLIEHDGWKYAAACYSWDYDRFADVIDHTIPTYFRLMKIHEQITAETWCQVSYAQDKGGKPVLETNREAVCWCSDGWLRKVYKYESGEYYRASEKIHLELNKMLGSQHYLGWWNDLPERKFEDVLGLFKKVDL